MAQFATHFSTYFDAYFTHLAHVFSAFGVRISAYPPHVDGVGWGGGGCCSRRSRRWTAGGLWRSRSWPSSACNRSWLISRQPVPHLQLHLRLHHVPQGPGKVIQTSPRHVHFLPFPTKKIIPKDAFLAIFLRGENFIRQGNIVGQRGDIFPMGQGRWTTADPPPPGNCLNTTELFSSTKGCQLLGGDTKGEKRQLPLISQEVQQYFF